MLTTVYEYNDNDQLIREQNTAQIVAIPAGGQQIAAASTGMSLLGASHFSSQVSGLRFRDLPHAISYWTFWSIPVLLLIAFLLPFALRSLRLCARPKYCGLPVFYRAISAVLALMFFIGFQPLEILAQEADLYAQLEAQDWGRHGSITNYEYDLNGSMIAKNLSDSNQTVDETFEYNLENRLVKHIKTSDVSVSDSITVATTTYLYNHEGIKVSKATEIVSVDKATSVETILNSSSESYLIDAYNHTGYAQVLEEVKESGAVTSYTIGDDILAQSIQVSGLIPQPLYFLYDGHGSTRQLTDGLGAVTGEYSYDSYGLMLGQQAGNQQEQATKLLYSGEQYDSGLQQYNMRARHYDPSNGRFNRLDPFSGSQYDPQSLHKYAYCHSDPVNSVDPRGLFSTFEFSIVAAIIGALVTIATLSHMQFIADAKWPEYLRNYELAAEGAPPVDFYAPLRPVLDTMKDGIESELKSTYVYGPLLDSLGATLEAARLLRMASSADEAMKLPESINNFKEIMEKMGYKWISNSSNKYVGGNWVRPANKMGTLPPPSSAYQHYKKFVLNNSK